MSKRKTINKFIDDSIKVHGTKYDYSQSIYVNNNTKVDIICPIHGKFSVRPNDHLSKKVGCNKCNNASISKSRNTAKIIFEKCKLKHNNKYDYSKSEYKKNDIKIKIICPIHGDFLQTPHHHLSGAGCQKCGNVYKKTTHEFVDEATKIHGTKYDYSECVYVNNNTKVNIICPIHGTFSVRPNDHLSKKVGCRKCLSYTNEEFITISNKRHNYRYNYSLVNIINNKTKVKITCPTHGIFEQIPINHVNGNGCPICKLSKGELIIKNYLDEKNIKYVRQKKFLGCKDKKTLLFDFYLPKENICIEFDGEQHYRPVNFFGGQIIFDEVVKRDLIKTEFCEKNNIRLVRFNKENINKINELFIGIKKQ